MGERFKAQSFNNKEIPTFVSFTGAVLSPVCYVSVKNIVEITQFFGIVHFR